jgi:hypothetical protein
VYTFGSDRLADVDDASPSTRNWLEVKLGAEAPGEKAVFIACDMSVVSTALL